MSSSLARQERLTWSLWVAAALAALGGLAPFLAGGMSSRLSSGFIPFEIAALAFAGCALFRGRGRAVAGSLYFVAGLALVYGMLSMFSLPLQLAVLGTCAAPPAPCTGGLPRPLTGPENTAIGVATGFAAASILVGFFGLVIVFRRAAVLPVAPPARTIPAVTPARPADSVKPAPEPVEPVQVKPAAASNGSAPAPEEPQPELPAHEEEDRPELPPHESNPPST